MRSPSQSKTKDDHHFLGFRAFLNFLLEIFTNRDVMGVNCIFQHLASTILDTGNKTMNSAAALSLESSNTKRHKSPFLISSETNSSASNDVDDAEKSPNFVGLERINLSEKIDASMLSNKVEQPGPVPLTLENDDVKSDELTGADIYLVTTDDLKAVMENCTELIEEISSAGYSAVDLQAILDAEMEIREMLPWCTDSELSIEAHAIVDILGFQENNMLLYNAINSARSVFNRGRSGETDETVSHVMTELSERISVAQSKTLKDEAIALSDSLEALLYNQDEFLCSDIAAV